MVIDDNGSLNVAEKMVMPRFLNGTKHVAVCTCGKDFLVLVTEILLRRLVIKADK